jgi:hypothetical protein
VYLESIVVPIGALCQVHYKVGEANRALRSELKEENQVNPAFACWFQYFHTPSRSKPPTKREEPEEIK